MAPWQTKGTGPARPMGVYVSAAAQEAKQQVSRAIHFINDQVGYKVLALTGSRRSAHIVIAPPLGPRMFDYGYLGWAYVWPTFTQIQVLPGPLMASPRTGEWVYEWDRPWGSGELEFAPKGPIMSGQARRREPEPGPYPQWSAPQVTAHELIHGFEVPDIHTTNRPNRRTFLHYESERWSPTLSEWEIDRIWDYYLTQVPNPRIAQEARDAG